MKVPWKDRLMRPAGARRLLIATTTMTLLLGFIGLARMAESHAIENQDDHGRRTLQVMDLATDCLWRSMSLETSTVPTGYETWKWG
jgi:hypothetical protein